jgi:hypothetical protein
MNGLLAKFFWSIGGYFRGVAEYFLGVGDNSDSFQPVLNCPEPRPSVVSDCEVGETQIQVTSATTESSKGTNNERFYLFMLPFKVPG